MPDPNLSPLSTAFKFSQKKCDVFNYKIIPLRSQKDFMPNISSCVDRLNQTGL